MGWIQSASLLVMLWSLLKLFGHYVFISADVAFLFLAAEAFLGKGLFKKRVSYHSKGRSGIKIRPECRLTVVVREITAEEEAEIARLKVHNFRKLTKREKRLVPHQLIETNPVWGRKSKYSNQNLSAAAAWASRLFWSLAWASCIFQSFLLHISEFP